MIYGIIGDIHANYEALTAVLAECEKLKVAKYFCIGDIVGYNADPGLCMETIQALPLAGVVMGNHDEREPYARGLFGEDTDPGAPQDRVHDVDGLRALCMALEEATGADIRAPGFPSDIVDDEPEEPGYEVVPRR